MIFFNLAASEVIVVVAPEPSSLVDAYALIKVMSLRHSKRDFHLVLNNVANSDEASRIFERFDAVASRFLGVTLNYLGHVPTDHHMPKAARGKRVLLEAFPFARASVCINRIARRVCDLPLGLLGEAKVEELFMGQRWREA